MVISLTSFPARLPYIGPCLASLVSQLEPDDRIVLWLGKEEFPDGVAGQPEAVRCFFQEFGGRVEVRYTEDIRSFTKLVPALMAFPNETIVTFDDDIIYHPETLSRLRVAHQGNPSVIFAHCVSDLYAENGEWRRTGGTFGFTWCHKNLRMMLGMGGVLYPPNSLSEIVTDMKLIANVTPKNDDFWFWYCATKKGTPILRAPNAISRPDMMGSVATIDALSAVNETDGDKVNRESLKRIAAYDPDFSSFINAALKRNHLSIFFARIIRFIFHYPRQIAFCLKYGGLGFLKAELRRYFS